MQGNNDKWRLPVVKKIIDPGKSRLFFDKQAGQENNKRKRDPSVIQKPADHIKLSLERRIKLDQQKTLGRDLVDLGR